MITFCRSGLVPHVGEVTTSSVACGLLGVAGNKGAAAISLSLYRRCVYVCTSVFALMHRKYAGARVRVGACAVGVNRSSVCVHITHVYD
jgi:hypothetical protein